MSGQGSSQACPFLWDVFRTGLPDPAKTEVRPKSPRYGMALAPQIPMHSEFLGSEELLARFPWPPPEGQKGRRTLSLEFFLSLFKLRSLLNSCLLPMTLFTLSYWHLCSPFPVPQHPLFSPWSGPPGAPALFPGCPPIYSRAGPRPAGSSISSSEPESW